MAFAKRQEAPAMIAHFFNFDIFFYTFPGFSDPFHSYGISCCAYNSPSLNTLVYYSWPSTNTYERTFFTHVQHVLNHQPYTPSPSLSSRYLYEMSCSTWTRYKILFSSIKSCHSLQDTSFIRHTHVLSSASECD